MPSTAFGLMAVLGLYASLIGPVQFATPVPASSIALVILVLICLSMKREVRTGTLLFFGAIVISGLAAALLHERLGVVSVEIFGRVINVLAVAVAAAFVTRPMALQGLIYLHKINTVVLAVGLVLYLVMLVSGADFFSWSRNEFHGAAPAVLKLRHTIFFSEPAYLCSLVAIHIASLSVLLKGLRNMSAAYIVLFSGTLVLTFSFSGVLTLAVFLSLVLIDRRISSYWTLLIALVAAGLVYVVTVVEPYLVERASLVVSGAKNEPRLMEFLRGFDAYRCGDLSAFIFGHGIGSFGVIKDTCYHAVNHQTSNNTLADILFENGLLAVAVLSIATLAFARRAGLAATALLVTAAMYKIELFGIGAIYYALIYRAATPPAAIGWLASVRGQRGDAKPCDPQRSSEHPFHPVPTHRP